MYVRGFDSIVYFCVIANCSSVHPPQSQSTQYLFAAQHTFPRNPFTPPTPSDNNVFIQNCNRIPAGSLRPHAEVETPATITALDARKKPPFGWLWATTRSCAELHMAFWHGHVGRDHHMRRELTRRSSKSLLTFSRCRGVLAENPRVLATTPFKVHVGQVRRMFSA